MSQSNKVTPNQVQEITKILNKNMGIFLKWLGTTYSPQYPQKEMKKKWKRFVNKKTAARGNSNPLAAIFKGFYCMFVQ